MKEREKGRDVDLSLAFGQNVSPRKTREVERKAGGGQAGWDDNWDEDEGGEREDEGWGDIDTDLEKGGESSPFMSDRRAVQPAGNAVNGGGSAYNSPSKRAVAASSMAGLSALTASAASKPVASLTGRKGESRGESASAAAVARHGQEDVGDVEMAVKSEGVHEGGGEGVKREGGWNVREWK